MVYACPSDRRRPGRKGTTLINRRLLIALWLLALGLGLLLTAANLWLGDVNQDEGWYLNAARLVADGKLPYRDFAFTQGPMLPLVYALFSRTFSTWGIVAGRLLTGIIGLLAALASALLAARITSFRLAGARGSTSEQEGGQYHGAVAALVTFILVAVNVYQSYFGTVVKTYPLCSLFLVAGFLVLTRALRAGRIRTTTLLGVLSGILLVCAAGTRLSAAVAAPIVFLCLLSAWLIARRSGVGGADTKQQAQSYGRAAVGIAIGTGIGMCLVFLPFYAAAPSNFVFWLIKYHSGRQAGGAVALLAYKAGFISRVVQAYFVAVSLLAALVIWRAFQPRTGEKGRCAAVSGRCTLVCALWLCVAAVSLLHFMAPFPYDDYQAAIFPLFAVALASGLARAMSTAQRATWLVVTVLLLSTAASFSSPINMAWALQERDRIWFRVKEQAPLARLQAAGKLVRDLSGLGSGAVLLTQDTYLAVESGLRVPEGLEMGPFAYYPDMSTADAKKRHVLNAELMKELLTNSDSPVAAFSGYSLTIKCPEVTELPESEQAELRGLLLERYELRDEIEQFGQGSTTLQIYVRKTE